MHVNDDLWSSSDTGQIFRDLNRNGIMDPFENPALSAEERVADLLPRLSLEEKVGLMFQTVIEANSDGTLLEGPGRIAKTSTKDVVSTRQLSHFNVHVLPEPRLAAQWHNALQRLAAQNPHAIPVTISTDPRHAFTENSALSFSASHLSQWPDSLGMSAINDEDTVREFAEIMREEYLALGIRAALHPQVDLASDPRWGRQLQTFGTDSKLSSRLTEIYLNALQGTKAGHLSVACTTKHFPGGGPQLDGEDPHFPYGREQVYPGGRFEEHLEPFKAAISARTAAMMPYYGMPVGLTVDGEEIEEVGFGFNKQIITGILRNKLGYDGVVVTDWELINDNHVAGKVLPARAWGVEHLSPAERMAKALDAGVDQFGGEQCTELLLELVRSGTVPEARIDESARRLLLIKFQLGLFDNPYVSEDHAAATVGKASFRSAGLSAQARSVVVLENNRVANGAPLLPLATDGLRIYAEGLSQDDIPGATLVDDPESADVAIVRIDAPYEPRNDLFLEAYFRQGSLELPPGLISRLQRIAATIPLLVDVALDRPAILTPLSTFVAGLTVTFGVSNPAYLSAVSGAVKNHATLPVEIPRSMEAVRSSDSDVPNSTVDPLYPVGYGLEL